MGNVWVDDMEVDLQTGEVLTIDGTDPLADAPQPAQSTGGRLVSFRAQLKDYRIRPASNGLNYTLTFEIAPGFGEEIGRALSTGACRLWWQPDGTDQRALISEGAIAGATGYAQKYDSDNFRHDLLYLKLTRTDVQLGVGRTLGLAWLPDNEQHGVVGVLGLEPNQQDLDLA